MKRTDKYLIRTQSLSRCRFPMGSLGIFHLLNPSGLTMALWSTHLLTEMSTRDVCWRVKAAGAQGCQPYHLHVPITKKFWGPQPPGSLSNFPGPYENSFTFTFASYAYILYIHIYNSVVLIRERTIPTERPPPLGEVSANFCG